MISIVHLITGLKISVQLKIIFPISQSKHVVST